MSFEEAGTQAASFLAITAACLFVYRLPPCQRAVSWYTKHRDEDRAERFASQLLEGLSAEVLPRLERVEQRSEQLVGNGGTSLVDKVALIEQSTTTLVGRFDAAEAERRKDTDEVWTFLASHGFDRRTPGTGTAD